MKISQSLVIGIAATIVMTFEIMIGPMMGVPKMSSGCDVEHDGHALSRGMDHAL